MQRSTDRILTARQPATFAGFGMVHPDVVWLKLESLGKGARRASAKLWRRAASLTRFGSCGISARPTVRQRSSVVEQGNHNPLVGGSNPSAATNRFRGLGEECRTCGI